jgi:hypothetical protein
VRMARSLGTQRGRTRLHTQSVTSDYTCLMYIHKSRFTAYRRFRRCVTHREVARRASRSTHIDGVLRVTIRV